MVTVKAFYEVDQSGPILIDERHVDGMLDKVAADAAEAQVPVAGMLEHRGSDGVVVLQFGVRPDGLSGFVGHIAKEGSVVSHNGADPGVDVDYDYMGSETPLDASAEIEFAQVRRAVHRFVTGGGARDEAIRWRVLA